MAKYSFEFKKKVVLSYLNGEGGYKYLSKTYGVPAKRNIEQWVHNYQTLGDEGLLRSRKNDIYSFEKKLSVVELYLSSEISYQDLALQEGIINSSMIANWVNRFRAAGPDALRPHKKGRKKTLDKSVENSKIVPLEESSVDTSVEHVKELEDGIDQRPSAKNVMDALDKAIEITADCPYRRTFHSDQGWAYQMKAYSHRLKEERIFQSMSRKGNCLDNSVMENFFGLLKQEIYYGIVYYSYEELKSEIERFIKYYNEKQIKEKLGWRSPVQYRLHLLTA